MMSVFTKIRLAALCCLLSTIENGAHSTIKREETTDNVRYVYTELNSPGSPLSISLVEIIDETRGRRGVHNSTSKWPHRIPYVLDPTYTAHGEPVVINLKRAIRRIMDNVCVTYIDVTNTWDKTNSHWFTENGYESNAYIKIRDSGGCTSASGPGTGVGARNTSPCSDFVINTHEMFHTVGGSHTHQSPLRDNYITINIDDIKPNLYYTYTKNTKDNFLNVGFDAMSVLLYTDTTWNRNGLETYTPIRDEFFDRGLHTGSDAAIFNELSHLYHCNELFCNNSTRDCSPGYHTLVRGVCQCVCPSELDPDLNCKELINKASSTNHWPNTPVGLLAGGPDSKCPREFDQQPGWMTFDGIWAIKQNPAPVPFPFHEKTVYLPICTKKTPVNDADIDWESWPPGGPFCMIKPEGADCGGSFEETTMYFESLALVQHNGSLGDTTISGNRTTMKLCCRTGGPAQLYSDFPDSEPFRLIAKGACPKINGLREYLSSFILFSKVTGVTGSIQPWHAIFSSEIQLEQCYYLPPIYGCNQDVTLSKEAPTVTITTPGFGVAREPNRRCLYKFTVPANAQVRITFNTYDLETDDYLQFKRYHPWQELYRLDDIHLFITDPYFADIRIDNVNWPAQFVSEGDYLTMEYWSTWREATRQGLNFTADVLLPEDSCFNVTTNGEDYFGNTSVTETYEECLLWSQTLDCVDFPKEGMNPIWLLLSGNTCRNPGGELLQPWCYVHKNGTNCHKRYCDVCNTKTPVDVIKNCSALKSAHPAFCRSAIERHGCFKTCGYRRKPANKSICDAPRIPQSGLITGPTKRSYQEGEKVTIDCPFTNNTNSSHVEMVCTKSGWSNSKIECSACPKDWVQYGDRCLRLSSDQLNFKDAETSCNGKGPNGTLFQIRNLSDQQMIQEYKQSLGSLYTGTDLISGQYRSDNGKWYFTNTDVEMTYFNWSAMHTSQISNKNYDCVHFIADYYADKGGWNPISCGNNDKYHYFCQFAAQDGPCSDRLSTSTCEKLLTEHPNFCSDSRFNDLAKQNCRKSCGVCVLATDSLTSGSSQCRENISTTIVRTSTSDNIDPGQVMTFTCKPGYFWKSGNLERACSSSGSLLGKPPVCTANPEAQDVKLNAVRPRHYTLTSSKAFLLMDSSYSVPFNGTIAKWYYVCKNSGLIHFLVYRQSDPSSGLTYVGSNNVTCETGRARTLFVPQADQISVQKGDVVGAYATTSNTLAVNNCTTQEHISKIAEATASNFSILQTESFSKESCLMASVGYRVLPV